MTDLRDAAATDAYQLAYFATPGAPPWVEEVEDWVRRSAWHWYRDPSSDDPRLRFCDDDDGISAVVAHHTWEPGVRYLMVVVLREDLRGRGLGRDLWHAAVTDAAQEGACGVFWQVHPDNAGALHLSREIASLERPTGSGYTTFTKASATPRSR